MSEAGYAIPGSRDWWLRGGILSQDPLAVAENGCGGAMTDLGDMVLLLSVQYAY